MRAHSYTSHLLRHPTIGARGLSAATTTVDGLGVVSLRGQVGTDNIGVMLTAIDAALDSGVTGLVLDGDEVSSWSVLGLEVAILTATRAAGTGRRFAMSGLPDTQLELIRRHWPGVAADQFSHRSAAEAARAVTAPPG